MPDDARPPIGEIILYQTEDGSTRVECRFADETLWLSQALIAELFQVAVPTVNEHLRNLYDEGELSPGPTIRRFRIVRREGAREGAREKETLNFFQTIQNKLHFAATGKTAPELIAGRADHTKPNMGLTAWKGGAVRKADVTVAKNYLNQNEIGELNRIVTMWLDFAEDQARRRKQVFLKDWEAKLDEFLRFNERAVLDNKGKVSKADADARAEAEYEEFAARRRALLEAEGEREQREALEDAAKRLPGRPKRERPRS